MHEYRRARVAMQLAKTSNVIDMRVRAYDGFNGKFVTTEQVQDTIDFVTRIDHQRLAANRIADDGAITLQHPHGNGDVYQSFGSGIQCWQPVAHE
jgi:hypothetical protein